MDNTQKGWIIKDSNLEKAKSYKMNCKGIF